MLNKSYTVVAIDIEQKKEFAFCIDAKNEEEIRSVLSNKFVILEIHKELSYFENLIENAFQDPITKSDIFKLLTFLAHALWRWVWLKKSLEFLKVSEEKKSVKLLIEKLLKRLDEQFLSYYDIFKDFPEHFDYVFLWIIRAWEQTWSISENILQYVQEQKKIEEQKQNIKWVFIKRGVLLWFVLVVATVITLFVIPQFIKLFKKWWNIPSILSQFSDISIFLKSYWLIIILTTLITTMIFVSFYKYSYKFKKSFDMFLIKSPLFGDIIRTYYTTKYLYFTWTLLKKNVNYIKIMDILIEQTKNIPFRDVFEIMKENVIRWVQLKDMLKWKINKKDNYREIPQWFLLPSLTQALEMWSATWSMWEILYEAYFAFDSLFHDKIKKWINIFDKIFYWFIILLMWILFYAMWSAMAGLYKNAWSIV